MKINTLLRWTFDKHLHNVTLMYSSFSFFSLMFYTSIIKTIKGKHYLGTCHVLESLSQEVSFLIRSVVYSPHRFYVRRPRVHPPKFSLRNRLRSLTSNNCSGTKNLPVCKLLTTRLDYECKNITPLTSSLSIL